MPLCSISVDLDPIWCYASIHGIDSNLGPDAVYDSALDRLLELFGEFGVHATFFVVGQDAKVERRAEKLVKAAQLGHEIANHSLNHRYDLAKQPFEVLRAEIDGAHQAILDHCGLTCVGYRAPGYNVDPRVLEIIAGLGYTYDSSIFPCPPYYLAKATVMALIRLRGKKSGSSMVDARTLLAPLKPYTPRNDAVHRRSRDSKSNLLELPMCVLPISRFPLIGTSLLMAKGTLSSLMIKVSALYHREFINIELHGIDLVDPIHDEIPNSLRERQPDLKISLDSKLETFRAVLSTLSKTHQFVSCRDATSQLSR